MPTLFPRADPAPSHPPKGAGDGQIKMGVGTQLRILLQPAAFHKAGPHGAAPRDGLHGPGLRNSRTHGAGKVRPVNFRAVSR